MSDAHSGKNAYADLLSGQANLGPQISEPDYNLIFSNSNASSIPFLDLPEDSHFVDFSGSELDYSLVFGSSNDDQAIGVSYQDLKKSPSNVRTQSATKYPWNSSESLVFSVENEEFTSEASFQSTDDKKHFKMSYHKTRAGSKDGTSGTIHVAQFHPKPGFTYFVDDSTMQESKVDKPDPSVISDIHRKLDFSDGILESKYTKKGMPNLHPQKSSRREANLENNYGFTKKSMASSSKPPEGIASQHAAYDNSLPFFGEEFDVNSAAAVSAAALKDAIQKAQESIRIAKELMERKMGGLRNQSDRVFEDGLRGNDITHEGNRTEDLNAKDTCETVDSIPSFLPGRRESTFRHEQDAPDFKDNEITSNSWKVINDVHAQNRPKTGKREPALATILNVAKNRISSLSPNQQVVGNREIAQFMEKHECNAKERNITKETLINQEVIFEKEADDKKAHDMGSIRKKLHADVMEKESAENVDKLSRHVEMEKPLIFQEDGNDFKTGMESQQKREYEIKCDSRELYDITRKQDQSKQHANSQQEDMEKRTANFDKIREYRPRIIDDDDIEEEIFEDACEWVQNEDEPIEFLGNVSNETEEISTYMAEVTERGRKLARIHVPTNDEKRSLNVYDYEESGEKFGELKLIASKKGFKSYRYEKHEDKQIVTNEIEVLQHAEYESGVIREIDSWSRDTSDNITETQEMRQPCMTDENSKTKQVDDSSRIIDRATNNVYDFKVCEVEETKVAAKLNKIEPFEPDTLVLGGAEDSETTKNMKTVFEVFPSEGSTPTVGLIDLDLGNSEAENRGKDFNSNMNLDNDPQISISTYIKNDYAFAEGGNHCDKEAVKSHPVMSDVELRHVVIMENIKAYPGPSVSSENEKVIQVDEEMRARRNAQMNGKSLCKTIAAEEKETKSDEGMKIDNVMEVNKDTPKVLFAMEGTETKKENSIALKEQEYLRKVYEESKWERQREIDRIVVGRIIQEARDRAFAEAREKAERASVERTTSEVRERIMAETRKKLEKPTTAVKPSVEKASIEAKLRSERAAVERATAEARERALEKALSQKTTSRTQVLQRPDDTYIESAQRSKARLERQERIMERVAKALSEKNMRDLLAQKEEAEKNRLAESLDTQIKGWSTGKEGNLRALLSTLQYILGPGSGWQPISLTDIVTSKAVKKAYRKATLYVHPDKLQQRGASIREKYICEKVFDLLKVGWARFSSEER
ncbi:J domain-containing protein [Heracleum sosnowskyi]|uniref:J domain-containing protein n=1 Tax=Heracleum sosnowskyi TaxID=360622 RepID=A0AAD8N076_9APIA|nr:J domain-containing protein [Heracleum sosnowskyi]